MTAIITNNQNNSHLVLSGVNFSTANFKKSDEYTRTVERKTVYIEIGNDEANEAVKFGMKTYASKDENGQPTGGQILVVPFSGETTVYNMSDMTKYKKEFDNKVDNFAVKGADIAITKGTKSKNDFYRVSAIKIVPAQVEIFKSDLFGDDAKYSTIEPGTTGVAEEIDSQAPAQYIEGGQA